MSHSAKLYRTGLSYDEAAARLGVSRRTFNRLLLLYPETLRPLIWNQSRRRVRVSALVRLETQLRRQAEESRKKL